MDNDQIQDYRRRLRTRIPLLGPWRQTRVFQELSDDGSAEAVRLLAEVTLWQNLDHVAEGAFQTLRKLAQEGNTPAREAMCRLVVQHEHRKAKASVLTEGYVPHDESHRALFFFMTEQWDKYEGLDFDHRLLRAAYDAADERLRRQIAKRARQEGRVEWVMAVVGDRREKRNTQMSEEEWKTTIALLMQSQKWSDLWQLTEKAPPHWCVRILRRIAKEGWKPAEGDRASMEELLVLAEQLTDSDLSGLLHARATLRGHKDNVRCLAISPDGTRLASGGADGSIRIWDLPGGELRHPQDDAHIDRLHALSFSPDGEVLVSAGRDGRIRVLSFHERTNHWINKAEGKKATSKSREVLCLAISPDSQILATGHADNNVYLWGLPDGHQLMDALEAHEHNVGCVVINPDSDLLASGAADGTICLWSLASGKLLNRLDAHFGEEMDGVFALAMSPDGELLASGGIDRFIRLWSLPSGRLVHSLESRSNGTRALMFTPDSEYLVSGGGSHALRLWHFDSGNRARILQDHPSEGACLAISPDGRYLAASTDRGYDSGRAVHLWDLSSAQKIASLTGHEGPINAIAFSPDGGLLVSASDDRTLRIWSAEVDRLARQPLSKSTIQDLQWIQKALAGSRLTPEERVWLEFTACLMRRRRRLDILVEDTSSKEIEPDVYDIEIEG